jgi:hypothetical protein
MGASDQPAGDSVQLAPPLLQKNHFACKVKESLAAPSYTVDLSPLMLTVKGIVQ